MHLKAHVFLLEFINSYYKHFSVDQGVEGSTPESIPRNTLHKLLDFSVSVFSRSWIETREP